MGMLWVGEERVTRVLEALIYGRLVDGFVEPKLARLRENCRGERERERERREGGVWDL